MPNGERFLRMRCPSCSQSSNLFNDIVNGQGLVQVDTLRSFRVAFKRTMHGLSRYLLQVVAAGEVACRKCGINVPIQVSSQKKEHDSPSHHPLLQRHFWVRGVCPNCKCKVAGFSADDALFGSTPKIQQFIQRHPRWLNEPDIPMAQAWGFTARLDNCH